MQEKPYPIQNRAFPFPKSVSSSLTLLQYRWPTLHTFSSPTSLLFPLFPFISLHLHSCWLVLSPSQCYIVCGSLRHMSRKWVLLGRGRLRVSLISSHSQNKILLCGMQNDLLDHVCNYRNVMLITFGFIVFLCTCIHVCM